MTIKRHNKIVLFDIDHTVFDTNLYRKNLYKNLALEMGVDPHKFSQTAQVAYQNLRKNTYYLDPAVFLNTILNKSENSTDLKKLESIFWENALYESCIYPDVKQTFKYLNSKNITVGIFSTGDLKHQKIKIDSLKEFLSDEHIHISPDKFKTIKDTINVYKNYQTFLVDDYPQILENAKLHHKNIFTVFIKRKIPHSGLVIPKNFKPDGTIKTLHELIDIIETNK